MPFDIDKAVAYLITHKEPGSVRECAKYVRLALVAGGIDTTGAPVPAKNYGPFLMSASFRPVAAELLTQWDFAKGDIVVIQPYTGGSVYGHIAMYTGDQWISDFAQRDMWGGPGYRNAKPAHVVFRYSVLLAGGALATGRQA